MSQQIVRIACALESSGQYIHITPLGPNISARDGRTFKLSRPDSVIAASSVSLPKLVDWEHRSEMYNGNSEAAGWIDTLEWRAGSGLYGRVSWTPKGKADVESGAYKFLSPVLVIDGETREVETIESVALTNTPALTMNAST